MHKKTTKEYSDELLTPIDTALISPVNTEKNQNQRIKDKKFEKLLLLFEHFNIEPDKDSAGLELALKLAEKHVPGFEIKYPTSSPPPRVGRPASWSGSNGIALYADIYKTARKGNSINQACHILCQTEQYKGEKADTLRQRYYEVLKRLQISEGHIESLNTIIEKAPHDIKLKELLKSYNPDGSALLDTPSVAKILADAFSSQ